MNQISVLILSLSIGIISAAFTFWMLTVLIDQIEDYYNNKK
jgi:hypothetical protein